MSIIGHAVNTFPVPANKYGAWLLSVVQFAVGQRTQAKQTRSVIRRDRGRDAGVVEWYTSSK
jgi:hypothetical protein